MGECTVAGESAKVENPESLSAGDGGGRGELLFRSWRRSLMLLVPPGDWHPHDAKFGEG